MTVRGRISKRLIDVLRNECGNDVHVSLDPEDETVDIFQTDWHRNIRKKLTPGMYMKVFRQNRSMTQVELGRALGGLPRQHVSKMEQGSRPIRKKVQSCFQSLLDEERAAFRFRSGCPSYQQHGYGRSKLFRLLRRGFAQEVSTSGFFALRERSR
jgi:hypothetical protein